MLRWVGRLFGDRTVETVQGIDFRSEERWRKLEQILGFELSDRTQYERALRHRSIIDDERYGKHETYERLEFLGDAVLDLIITELLFENYPEKNEGFLTKLRAKLVRGDTLASLTRKLELHTILEIGDRAQGQGIELSKSVLADLFESIVAAIYLTDGYQAAYRFVEKVINENLNLEGLLSTVDNYKSELLEYTQAEKLPLPVYRVESESGPGHDKTFEVVVLVGESIHGKGTGKSKKEAEQRAAMVAFERLTGEPDREE